jgi:predicted ATPase
MWLGEFAWAREYFEQGIALYNPQQHRSHTSRGGQDPGVVCLSTVALVLWFLGYPDQALKSIQEALTLAQELSQPFSLGHTLQYTATLHLFRREEQAVQERAEAVITLSTEQGFPHLLADGTVDQGWALAAQGQGEQGIAQMHQGVAAFRATGAELSRTWYLGPLAEAYGKVGQAGEGLTLLAEVLDLVHKTGERVWEAELYRLKGQLTLQKFQVSGSKFLAPSSQAEVEAEACFHKAIEVARQQQAKSLELRAAMSLSRLWQQQGKKDDARQLLAEIYDWFTEGFDTKDLQEAKALLEQLT